LPRGLRSCSDRRGARGDRRFEVKRRFLAKDRPLELAQRRARLERQLLDQHPPGVLIGGERIGLPAAPVQRQHQLCMQMLAQRMLLNQHLELADQFSLAPELEISLDAFLQRREPQLLQLPDRRLRERRVGEIVKRSPAPQAERLAQLRGRLRRLGRVRLAHQPLEAVKVKLVAIDAQQIPRRAGGNPPAGTVQRLSQLRDPHLQRGPSRLRSLLAP
jgi:hypothetical protein